MILPEPPSAPAGRTARRAEGSALPPVSVAGAFERLLDGRDSEEAAPVTEVSALLLPAIPGAPPPIRVTSVPSGERAAAPIEMSVDEARPGVPGAQLPLLGSQSEALDPDGGDDWRMPLSAMVQRAPPTPAAHVQPPAPPELPPRGSSEAPPLGEMQPVSRPAPQVMSDGTVVETVASTSADPKVERAASAPDPLLGTSLQHAHSPAPTHGSIAPVVQAVVDPRAVAAQIVFAIARTEEPGIEIRLDPPELGRVHIHLAPVEGGIQAVVLAQRPETHDLLRRHAELLAQELADAGFSAVTFHFSTSGETGGRPDDRRAPDWFALDPPPQADTATPLPVRWTRLDIRL